MNKLIAKRGRSTGIFPFRHHLSQFCSYSHRCFNTFNFSSPEIDIIKQIIGTAVKYLLPFLNRPNLNAIFIKPS